MLFLLLPLLFYLLLWSIYNIYDTHLIRFTNNKMCASGSRSMARDTMLLMVMSEQIKEYYRVYEYIIIVFDLKMGNKKKLYNLHLVSVWVLLKVNS